MSLITWIISFLLISPIYWVVTDYKYWKIKNYFIFPLLLISILLTFFIDWFYSNFNNILWFILVLWLWYFFYINHKWGAGDWKYIILIWLNSIIISYLIWNNSPIINKLFLYIFLLLIIYILFFIILNIKKFSFKTNILKWFDLFKSLYLISFIYIISWIIIYFFQSTYIFLLIFLLLFFLFPYILKINNKFIYSFIIILSFFLCFYFKWYFSYWLIFIFYFIFYFIQKIFSDFFDIIDIKELNLLDIKQWDILTNKSIDLINKDVWIKFLESPLQWNEVYDLIWIYKKNRKNPKIYIYKDFRIWIIIYIWFILTFLNIFILT